MIQVRADLAARNSNLEQYIREQAEDNGWKDVLDAADDGPVGRWADGREMFGGDFMKRKLIPRSCTASRSGSALQKAQRYLTRLVRDDTHHTLPRECHDVARCKLPAPSSGVKGLPVTDPLIQKVIKLVALDPIAYQTLTIMVDRLLQMVTERAGRRR